MWVVAAGENELLGQPKCCLEQDFMLFLVAMRCALFLQYCLFTCALRFQPEDASLDKDLFCAVTMEGRWSQFKQWVRHFVYKF